MTYRTSFLLTEENPIFMDDLETFYGNETDHQAVMANPKPLTNGLHNGNYTEGDRITSTYFLKKEVERLKGVLNQEREKNSVDLYLKDISTEIKEVSPSSPLHSFKARKTLKEDHKITSFDWSPDQRHIVCGTENGSAYVWDGFTGQKEMAIQTPCRFVMSCTYSPSTTLVGCCGFNGRCSLYSVDKKKSIVSTPKKEVGFHNEYMTNCSFFGSDQQILTAGKDGRVALWDVEMEDPLQTYLGHTSTVSGLAINRKDPFSLFASCGDDHYVYVWDARSQSGRAVQRVDDIESEVIEVQFFPTGEALGYTTADGKTYLYDLKACKVLQTFYKSTIMFGGSSLDFSTSGRILFVGYEDCVLRAWDTLKGDSVSVFHEHEERISHVRMSNDGMALATSSWDGQLKIWA